MDKVKELRDVMRQAMEERRREMIRMYEEDGLSLEEIARHYDVTKARVHQIVNMVALEDRPVKRR